MNWIDMQNEHLTWLVESFPDQPAYLPVSGIFEELGEAAHCLLKHRQKVMHGEHPRYAGKDWMAELQDAVGDAVIYLSSACCCLNIDLQELMDDVDAPTKSTEDPRLQFCLLANAGTEASLALRLATADPKSSVSRYQILDVLCAIKTFSDAMGFDFESVVQKTWDEVKQRRRK